MSKQEKYDQYLWQEYGVKYEPREDGTLSAWQIMFLILSGVILIGLIMSTGTVV